jgi:hypothetical protein
MTMMLIESDNLRKVANYVAAAQKVIEKQAAQDAAVREKAPEVADVLVRQGLLSEHLKAAKAQAFINDPVELCSAVQDMAAQDKQSIGGGVEQPQTKEASQKSANDVFVERLMS